MFLPICEKPWPLDSDIGIIYNSIAGILPEVRASSPFLPTFYETESESGNGCHAPAKATGEGKSLPQGTGLLDIAGEKMEGSGTLGYPQSAEGCIPPLFVLLYQHWIDEEA